LQLLKIVLCQQAQGISRALCAFTKRRFTVKKDENAVAKLTWVPFVFKRGLDVQGEKKSVNFQFSPVKAKRTWAKATREQIADVQFAFPAIANDEDLMELAIVIPDFHALVEKAVANHFKAKIQTDFADMSIPLKAFSEQEVLEILGRKTTNKRGKTAVNPALKATIAACERDLNMAERLTSQKLREVALAQVAEDYATDGVYAIVMDRRNKKSVRRASEQGVS
jgi:hypothetical protein